MLKFLKWFAIALGFVLVTASAAFAVASYGASSRLAQTFDTHRVEVPVPMPLDDDAIAALREELLEGRDPEEVDGDPLDGVDLSAIALERAVARGEHLVRARFACTECHGQDFGGGVMIDDPAIGRLLGPNLTTGFGSRTIGYTFADWDRIVRHGVKPNGTPSPMPSEDFVGMSDQELSDIVAYVRSVPPVDREVPASTLGPIGTILLATGNLPLSADAVHDHHAAHPPMPPEPTVGVEFGRHLAQVCTGCHRANFEGGPIAAGPPDWAPAANLTGHAEGLAGWTYEQFVEAMREGVRPDGSVLREPMTLIKPYAVRMTDVELQAIWTYLVSVPPLPKGR